MKIFDDTTYQLLPAHLFQKVVSENFEQAGIIADRYQRLQGILQADKGIDPIAELLLKQLGLTETQSSPILDFGRAFFESPLIAPNVFMRKQVIEGLYNKLLEFKVLNLLGITGSGKTTLIHQVVANLPQEKYWVNFRDKNSAVIDEKLKSTLLLCTVFNKPICLILEDINFKEDARIYQDNLIKLVNQILTTNGLVIISSYTEPPNSISTKLGLNNSNIALAPSFEEDEISQYLKFQGCPEGGNLNNWVQVLYLQTGGHPQLVNILVKQLKDADFPECQLKDLIHPPKGMEAAREEATNIIKASLDEHSRLLL